MAEDVRAIGYKLAKRRSNIARTKEGEGLVGITGFKHRMDKQMAVQCNSCGLIGPVDVGLEVTRLRNAGPPRCKSCADENEREQFKPNSLALRRANLWKANAEDQSDHLVALKEEQGGSYVLCPAFLVPNQGQCMQAGITGEEVVMVMVPNTPAACKRLEGLAIRALEDWNTGLCTVTEATEGSRVLLLQDDNAFIQAASVVYRSKMASFRKYQIDAVTAGNKASSAPIKNWSPKKISASNL